MDVQEFVRASLVQIAEGVKLAQVDCQQGDNGAMIEVSEFETLGKSSTITFDIAITTERASDGGGKIAIAGLLSAGAGSGSRDSTVSRIQFQVRIRFNQQAAL